MATRRPSAAMALAVSAALVWPVGSLSLPAGRSRASKKPTIVVLGRPNVGKSTIANRMTQRFDEGALVHDQPGVTRDRTYGQGWWSAYEFNVVDTGGIVFDDDPSQVFMPQIRQQALTALAEAQVALLVVDGMAGCTRLDEDIASFMRKQKVRRAPPAAHVSAAIGSRAGVVTHRRPVHRCRWFWL
jgi:GTP-binding protein